jgi:hypothetical protein
VLQQPSRVTGIFMATMPRFADGSNVSFQLCPATRKESMMAKRTGWYVLMAMAATLWWQSSCSAQAFFPLQRVDDTVWDTKVHVVLGSSTTDSVDVVDPVDDGIDSTEHDTNYTIVNEATSAVDGDSNAESTAIAEAEILPAASSWMMLAQCITSISGLWDLNTSATGYAAAGSDQDAEAAGSFEVLANASYPSATLGTAHVTFTIILESPGWSEGEIHMTCGDTAYDVRFSEDYYSVDQAEGMEGSGPFGGTLVFTDSFDVEVGDVIKVSASISGSGGNSVYFGDSDSKIPGVSVNTSVYVSER